MTNINLQEIYARNELLWGAEAQQKLFSKHVVVFGLGGVGSYAAEALARSGVGALTFIDFDTVSASNINRQLLALIPDIGKSKVDLMKERINQINPHIKVNCIHDFYRPEINDLIFTDKVDFVIDAIDSLKAKVELLETCVNKNIPVISSMGAGNRVDPTQLYIADISEINTKKCPFAKNVKYRLKNRNIVSNLPVVASTEKPSALDKIESTMEYIDNNGEKKEIKKISPGSCPFVPPVAGYMLASYVVNSFIKN